MAKKVNFNDFSNEELNMKLKDFEKQLIILRMQKNQRMLKDTSQIRKIRKDIARIKTVLNVRKKNA
ncbi:MAG: 50S ribosomal protein L29 [Elusimicrobia bacterium]|nr:50S ribosomal protein L29 [Elusimicrobiota bacterium]